MEVLSAFRVRGADRRWGFGARCGLKVREETGWVSHTTERHRVKEFKGDWTVCSRLYLGN